MSHSDRGRTRWHGVSRDGEGKAADGKQALSGRFASSSPKGGAKNAAENPLASHFGKDSLRPEGDVAQRQREDKVARRKP